MYKYVHILYKIMYVYKYLYMFMYDNFLSELCCKSNKINLN